MAGKRKPPPCSSTAESGSPIVPQECDTGIQGVGKIPWGSHFCNFYHSEIDLAECAVPFFKPGLDNEMGFWITSDPLNAPDARRLLGELQPDLADREASGQITILDFADWYLGPTGSVTAEALRESLERLAGAQQQGWAGVRMSGNSFWLERKYWALFSEYEQKLEQVVRASKIVVLCSYSLHRCSVRDRAEILRHHDFAITRGATGWQIAKT